jgi:hypothetical protein
MAMDILRRFEKMSLPSKFQGPNTTGSSSPSSAKPTQQKAPIPPFQKPVGPSIQNGNTLSTYQTFLKDSHFLTQAESYFKSGSQTKLDDVLNTLNATSDPDKLAKTVAYHVLSSPNQFSEPRLSEFLNALTQKTTSNISHDQPAPRFLRAFMAAAIELRGLDPNPSRLSDLVYTRVVSNSTLIAQSNIQGHVDIDFSLQQASSMTGIKSNFGMTEIDPAIAKLASDKSLKILADQVMMSQDYFPKDRSSHHGLKATNDLEIHLRSLRSQLGDRLASALVETLTSKPPVDRSSADWFARLDVFKGVFGDPRSQLETTVLSTLYTNGLDSAHKELDGLKSQKAKMHFWEGASKIDKEITAISDRVNVHRSDSHLYSKASSPVPPNRGQKTSAPQALNWTHPNSSHHQGLKDLNNTSDPVSGKMYPTYTAKREALTKEITGILDGYGLPKDTQEKTLSVLSPIIQRVVDPGVDPGKGKKGALQILKNLGELKPLNLEESTGKALAPLSRTDLEDPLSTALHGKLPKAALDELLVALSAESEAKLGVTPRAPQGKMKPEDEAKKRLTQLEERITALEAGMEAPCFTPKQVLFKLQLEDKLKRLKVLNEHLEAAKSPSPGKKADWEKLDRTLKQVRAELGDSGVSQRNDRYDHDELVNAQKEWKAVCRLKQDPKARMIAFLSDKYNLYQLSGVEAENKFAELFCDHEGKPDLSKENIKKQLGAKSGEYFRFNKDIMSHPKPPILTSFEQGALHHAPTTDASNHSAFEQSRDHVNGIIESMAEKKDAYTYAEVQQLKEWLPKISEGRKDQFTAANGNLEAAVNLVKIADRLVGQHKVEIKGLLDKDFLKSLQTKLQQLHLKDELQALDQYIIKFPVASTHSRSAPLSSSSRLVSTQRPTIPVNMPGFGSSNNADGYLLIGDEAAPTVSVADVNLEIPNTFDDVKSQVLSHYTEASDQQIVENGMNALQVYLNVTGINLDRTKDSDFILALAQQKQPEFLVFMRAVSESATHSTEGVYDLAGTPGRKYLAPGQYDMAGNNPILNGLIKVFESPTILYTEYSKGTTNLDTFLNTLKPLNHDDATQV